MAKRMYVHFVVGLNGDRVEVTIKGDAVEVFKHGYAYGYNASYNRQFARLAEVEYENAIKYKWKGPRILKPFIGDILKDLIETHYIGNDDIEYSGYYVLAGRAATPEEVQKWVDKIADEV